jgi:hypothetical protein
VHSFANLVQKLLHRHYSATSQARAKRPPL